MPFYLIHAAVSDNQPMIIAYGLLYLLWVIVLSVLARKIGSYQQLPIIFFPVLSIGFMIIFFLSLVSKILGLPVKWKGRVVTGENQL